jgi:translation initiation factor 3 subunit B
VEFSTPDEALFALDAMNGHNFDAKHTFSVNRFSDVEKYANMDEAYVEPEKEEYKPRVRTGHSCRAKHH